MGKPISFQAGKGLGKGKQGALSPGNVVGIRSGFDAAGVIACGVS